MFRASLLAGVVLLSSCGRSSYSDALDGGPDASGGQGDAGTTPELVAVQSGTTALLAGDSTINVSISAVDPDRSFLVFSSSSSSSQPYDLTLAGQLTDGTTITFTRSGTGGTAPISWYVAEFASGVTVHRGSLVMNSTSQDVTFPAVDLQRSFPLVSFTAEGATFGKDDFIRARLVDSTTLRLTVGSIAAAPTVQWQVIEYGAATVRTGNAALLTSETSTAASIPQVVDSKSWLIYTYTAGYDDGNSNSYAVRGVIDSPTSLAFSRYGSGLPIDLTWYLVEFTDATQVRQGTEQIPQDEYVRTATIEAMTAGRSVFSGGAWGRGGATSCNGPACMQGAWMSLVQESPTSIRIERGQPNAGALSWFGIEF